MNSAQDIALPRSMWRRPMQLQLSRLQHGRLEVVEAGRRVVLGGQGESGGLPLATLEVVDSACWRAIATGGALGAAEAYMEGQWRSPDLAGLLRLMLRNQGVMEGLEGPFPTLGAIGRWVGHALRRNTRSGSRRNIAEHYDVGNEFFQLFLDPTMLYSCAYFPSDEASLEEASIAKLDRLCEMLRLRPGLRVLEIGSGWGACAVHMARKYGCKVVSVTISEAAARRGDARRVKEAGLEDRVEIRMQDYRDIRGQFDRLISIEMIEAVGAQYLGLFFKRCSDLLASPTA